MAIKYTNEYGWIISHPSFFENITVETCSSTDDKVNSAMRLKEDLFKIQHAFKTGESRKMRKCGKRFQEKVDPIAQLVKSLSEKLITTEAKATAFENPTLQSRPTELNDVNKLARRAANDFYEQVKNVPTWGKFYGENNKDLSIVTPMQSIVAGSHQFVFPPKTRFYCNDVYELPPSFSEQRFDLVIMDPPWRNKYVRTKKRKQNEAGYQLMQDNEDLKQIPIASVLKDDGIIAVWCTNSPSHKEHLKASVFPSWNIEYLTTWFWLKVVLFDIFVTVYLR